jgi:hypothetical protein
MEEYLSIKTAKKPNEIAQPGEKRIQRNILPVTGYLADPQQTSATKWAPGKPQFFQTLEFK